MYLGLDPSLTGFGIVCIDTVGGVVEEQVIKTSPHDFACFAERVEYLLTQALTTCHLCAPTLVAVEAPASVRHRVSLNDIRIYGLNIMLEWQLWKRRFRTISIPPRTLKLYATGSGKASKAEVMQGVSDRWGYATKNNNLADAYTLAQIARGYVSRPRPRDFKAVADAVRHPHSM